MKRVSFFLGWIFLLVVAVSAQDKIVKLKIVETSDMGTIILMISYSAMRLEEVWRAYMLLCRKSAKSIKITCFY